MCVELGVEACRCRSTTGKMPEILAGGRFQQRF